MYKYRIALFFGTHPYCKISYNKSDGFEEEEEFVGWLGEWKFMC